MSVKVTKPKDNPTSEGKGNKNDPITLSPTKTTEPKEKPREDPRLSLPDGMSKRYLRNSVAIRQPLTTELEITDLILDPELKWDCKHRTFMR